MKSLKDRIEEIDVVPEKADPDALIPGTVFNERQARMIKNAVIIMGLMLIGGFALLIGIIAYRASQPDKPLPPVAPAGVTVPKATIITPIAPPVRVLEAGAPPRSIKGFIPKGATFLASTISGNRLVLTLRTRRRGLKLVLIDLQNWQIIGEAELRQKK